jgi:hypothetical protein
MQAHKVLFLGLAIAITSCTNPTEQKTTQVIVTETTTSPQNTPVTVFSTTNPIPVSQPTTQISPRPRPKRSPRPTNSGEIPIVIEGEPSTLRNTLPRTEKPKLNTASLETEIKNSLSQEFNLKINSVKCINLASVSQDKKTTCRVVTPDGNFSIKLTKTGNQFEYEPQGILKMTELESHIETYLKNRQGKSFEATCSEQPGEVLIFNQGDYLSCQLKNPDGDRQPAKVTFNNLTGNAQGITVTVAGGKPSSTSSAIKPTKPQTKTPTIAVNSQAPNKNSDKLEKRLKILLTQETGTPIKSVNCPDRVEKNFTKSYSCQAITERGKFSLIIQLTTAQGGFKYQAKGAILPTKLGETISKEVEDSTGKKVEVDCGETLIIFTPRDTLGCQLSTGRGDPQSIKVTIQDEYGKKVKVNYSLGG